ncbi:unnamed protein product [Boreogadus saida]
MYEVMTMKPSVGVCVDDGWFKEPHLAESGWTLGLGEAAQQIIMMSWTYVFLPVILGAVVSCQDVLSNPVVELTNITDSHLGLYYCGTEQLNGEKGNKKRSIYTYGKIITRILLDIPLDAGAGDPAAADCGQCWMLLVTLCPSSALLSLFLYFLCSHMVRAGKHPGISQETRPLTLQDEDENYSRVFYAVLETPQHKGSHSFLARSTSGL